MTTPRTADGRDVDEELLRLVMEVAALDAAALIIRDDAGAVLRASWPTNRAGLELEDVEAGALEALLADAGGSGGSPLISSVPLDDDVEVILAGSLDPSGDGEQESALQAVEVLAGLVASRLAVDSARRHAEDARTRMAGLVEAGLALGREAGLDDLLARIVQSAREVLGARYAALGVLDESHTELASFVTAGLSEAERRAIGPLPRGRGLLGALIREPRPLRLARIADDARSSGFPANHPPMESFLGVPIALRGQVYGNLYLTDKAGGAFTDEDEQIALTYAAQAAVAIDNVRRFEDQQRRADELESVMEVARALMGTRELDALLPLVARQARRLAGADTVGVAIIEGERLVFRYAHGVDALTLEGARMPPEPDGLAAGLGALLGASAVHVCPLEVGGEVVGALAVVGHSPFAVTTKGLLETFSGQAAIAVTNARMLVDERESAHRAAEQERVRERGEAVAEGLHRAVEAQESERARVARELHDESGQVLTALSIHLRALEEDVGPGEIRERLAALRASVGEASTNLRALATRLRPAALFETGLTEAIDDQAERLRSAGIAVDVDVRGFDAEISEEIQTILFRVVQEALTNVARHSGAACASVFAAVAKDRLRLVVEDDGCGFDPSTPTSHLGLAGIRERIELIGGVLRIESAAGAGAAVVVDLAFSE